MHSISGIAHDHVLLVTGSAGVGEKPLLGALSHNSTPSLASQTSKLRIPRRRRQHLLIYSFLTFRKHGGWQEQEIVQGQEGPEEENRPLRKEGLVLRQGPLHLRRQRVRHTHTRTSTRTQRSRRKRRRMGRKRAGDAMREHHTNIWPVSARPSSTAPPV